MKKTATAVVATLAAVALGSTALATMEIQKGYKEANKDAKPNCQTCHVDKMPKKDGPHDLNDFGKAVLAAKGKDGKIDWTKVKEPEAKK